MMDAPEGFDPTEKNHYRIESGALVFDEGLKAAEERREQDMDAEMHSVATRQDRVNILLLETLAPSMPDEQKLTVSDAWPELLIGGTYSQGFVGWFGERGRLYEVVSPGPVTIQAHQPPGGEGMLAVYRPIVPEAAGTLDDPKAFVYGMDVAEGLYYLYEGAVWRAKKDMKPCVWLPSAGNEWEVA
ncbi:hypothetical protein LJC74_01665 [Eubacteriales bacterium OttesenSCG-928-A19]|nr:hypothetical protein [Eubacteriales bacterium OttesenSCG-928-A19]